MKQLSSKLVLIASFGYPLWIYFCGRHLSSIYSIALPIILLMVRSAIHYRDRKKGFAAMTGVVALMMCGLCFLSCDFTALLYPVIMNLSFAFLAGSTLLYPPSLIERFARSGGNDLDARGIAYTRKVTIVWLIFSLINAGISFVTVWINNHEIWLIYNGFISYILIGLLIGVEYMFRCYYRRKSL